MDEAPETTRTEQGCDAGSVDAGRPETRLRIDGPARPKPAWTTREVALLREHYPDGGAQACAALLPHRSLGAIYQQAIALKLRAPQSLTKRARTLGLTVPRFKEPVWSTRELALLKQHAHKDDEVIARILRRAGSTRSANAIHVKRTRVKLSVAEGRRDAGLISAGEVAALPGVDAKTVTCWIAQEGLPARRRGTAHTESRMRPWRALPHARARGPGHHRVHWLLQQRAASLLARLRGTEPL